VALQLVKLGNRAQHLLQHARHLVQDRAMGMVISDLDLVMDLDLVSVEMATMDLVMDLDLVSVEMATMDLVMDSGSGINCCVN